MRLQYTKNRMLPTCLRIAEGLLHFFIKYPYLYNIVYKELMIVMTWFSARLEYRSIYYYGQYFLLIQNYLTIFT